MSKWDNATAEGSVAPENLPSEERRNSSSKKSNNATAEGSVAPENTKSESEAVIVTINTGPVTIGVFTFPSKQFTGTPEACQKKKEEYELECQREVIRSYWIVPKEMEGDLLAGYFNGTVSQEECEQLALEYLEQYALYNNTGVNAQKRVVIRASVISCEYSDRLTHLDIYKDHGVQDQGGNAVLTCRDCKVGENLFSFGICKSPLEKVQKSPVVTIQDGKYPGKGHLCMMQVATEWMISENEHVHIYNEDTQKYEKRLLDDSMLVCSYGGGRIRIVEVPLINSYEVRFINDCTEEVIDTQSVIEGDHAVPPKPSEISGFKFYKWDSRKYRNVTKSVDVRAIYNPEEYGNPSTLITDDALEEYMSLLAPDLNETRREVIQYALESVGTIPYYWGGKAKTPGYTQSYKRGGKTANDFNKPCSADYKNRDKRGLDCSGWVYWVRWTVTGNQEHHASGTWQLSKEGEATTIDNLKPGDIIGESEDHVIMFLAYKGDKIIYIQESGGNGNVNVKEDKIDWLDGRYSYKRNLDRWYENE